MTSRSVVFDCSGSGNGPALRVYLPPFTGSALYPPHWSVAPVFTLPGGYLQLSPQPLYESTCPYPTQPVLKSGQSIVVGFEGLSLNYCAVISNSVGKVDGFSIKWHPAPFPSSSSQPFFEFYASPPSITIPAGQTGRSTLFITSLHRFNGTVEFWGRSTDSNLAGKAASFFVPSTVVLGAGGSNSTVANVIPFSNAPRGLYAVSIFGQSDGNVNGTDINVSTT